MTDSSIANHLTYLKRRNAQETTVEHRRGQLRRLSEHLGIPLLEATEEDLDRWQRGLRVCASSVQTYSSHVRAFYDWAHENGLTETNVGRNLVMPKIQRRLPRPIPEKDLTTGLTTAMHDLQLYCWLLLAGYCGLRASEVARVSRSDFRDADNGGAYLTVHGKGGKDRIVRVPPDVYDELRPFMHVQGALFKRRSGEPHTGHDVTKIASAHFKSLGLPYTLHTLRHRFGTRLADLGADPRDIQSALGHADLATTSLYLATNVRRGASSVDKLGKGLRTLSQRRPTRASAEQKRP